jgi:Reverse transcriptase (RNA-dependent DNA polymerase)
MESNHHYIPKSRRTIHYGRITYRQQVLARVSKGVRAWLVQVSTKFKRTWDNRQRIQSMQRQLPKPDKTNSRWRPNFLPTILAFAAVAFTAEHSDRPSYGPSDMFDTDSRYVGIDNRASACMSDDIADFVGPLAPTNRIVKGFAGHRTANVQCGTIEWQWEDDTGKVCTHRIPNSYYVPDGKVRLLSPQHWASTLPVNQRPPKGVAPEQTFHNRVELYWANCKRTVYMDEHTNVATLPLAPSYHRYAQFCMEAQIDDARELHDPCYAESSEVMEFLPEHNQDEDFCLPTADDHGLNGPVDHQGIPIITEDDMDSERESATAEFLRYHHKYNHLSPRRIQAMALAGTIPRRLARCPVPICTACLFGKATRKPWRGKHTSDGKGYKPVDKPGQVVSVDQMVSPTKGFVAQMTGILTTKRYTCAMVFVDHATDLSYIHLQHSASAEDTVVGKKAFELYARQFGVRVRHYHGDNGIFTAHLWRNDCTAMGQGLSFAGVNAHHQNGRAERRIRELQQTARTMLIHAQRRWPTAISANLWPYAMRLANDALNATPRIKVTDNQSPLSLFAGASVDSNPIHWHHFGCPVYVLDNALQGSTGLFNKWRSRARVGVYLGRSPQHARSVALVLSLETGLVSPQFHVSFDSSFQTVANSKGEPPTKSEWQDKAGFSESPDSIDSSPPEWHSKGANEPLTNVPSPIDEGEGAGLPIETTFHHVQEDANVHEAGSADATPPVTPPALTLAPTGSSTPVRHNPRPQRATRPPERLITTMPAVTTTIAPTNELFSLQALFPDEASSEWDHPLLAYAATSDPDTLYYHEAMKAEDASEFTKAMEEEVNGQLASKVYQLIRRRDVPTGYKVLPSVWAMRRKRKSKTGKVYQHKSRLNIGGHKQREGLDYDQTFAPVATWPSIRLLLINVLTLRWHSRQIDYVQAYPQAQVDRPMYMEIPQGFSPNGEQGEDYVLEVLMNIYGSKQAGRVWNTHLVGKLVSIGFVQSKHDPCVFYKGRAMYVLYTDDSILAGPDSDELDDIIEQIKSTGLKITSEATLEDFLGVNIDHREDGTIHMTQTRLIDSILADLGLDKPNVAGKDTPAATSKLLSHHPRSAPFDCHFDYRSVVGKMLYLEKCTCPNLAYAVHQCARFSASPKYEHGQAVKWLGRYLHDTRDKGMIYAPNDKGLELYVDSDWSGNWDKEVAADEPDTARSRHGYVLNYRGCPIFWASQMQTEFAMSSTEAEYIGLSRALRETIPIMEMLKEMQQLGFDVTATQATVRCKVFEDNTGALEMANVHKLRPRTKHINIKYHHFRSHVSDGSIAVQYIPSKDNVADMLTKGQPIALLRVHRAAIMGWDTDVEKGCNNPSIAHEDVRGDDSLNPTNGQTHTQGAVLTNPIVSHTGVSPTQSYGSDTNLVGMDGVVRRSGPTDL